MYNSNSNILSSMSSMPSYISSSFINSLNLETQQHIPKMNQNLSLFIPRVHNSMTEHDIQTIFDRLNFGTIKRIDLIIPGMKHDPHQELEEDITTPPEPLPLFNIAFIHYSTWNTFNAQANMFYRQVFDNNEEVRIQYDAQGHFFKVYKNKCPKPDEQYELEQAFIKQQKIIQQLKQRCSFYNAIFNDMNAFNCYNGDVSEEYIPRPPFVVGETYKHSDGSLFRFVQLENGKHDFILVENETTEPNPTTSEEY